MKRDKCYLVPVGGDSLDFMRIHAGKRPDSKTIKALQELCRVAASLTPEQIEQMRVKKQPVVQRKKRKGQ